MTSSARSAIPPPTDGLIVGELVGPFGIHGEVKLYPLTDYPERLGRYRRLVLALPDGSQREVRVQRARPHKNLWVLKLRETDTPEAAEALRGARAILPSNLAEPLPEGHFYLHEVIGLRAVTAAGEEIGTVTDVLRSPANDVYVVGDLLIPAVKQMVVRIDPAEGVLVVRSREALASEEVTPERDTVRTEVTRSHGDTESRRRRVAVRGRSPNTDADHAEDQSAGSSSS